MLLLYVNLRSSVIIKMKDISSDMWNQIYYIPLLSGRKPRRVKDKAKVHIITYCERDFKLVCTIGLDILNKSFSPTLSFILLKDWVICGRRIQKFIFFVSIFTLVTVAKEQRDSKFMQGSCEMASWRGCQIKTGKCFSLLLKSWQQI